MGRLSDWQLWFQPTVWALRSWPRFATVRVSVSFRHDSLPVGGVASDDQHHSADRTDDNIDRPRGCWTAQLRVRSEPIERPPGRGAIRGANCGAPTTGSIRVAADCQRHPAAARDLRPAQRRRTQLGPPGRSGWALARPTSTASGRLSPYLLAFADRTGSMSPNRLDWQDRSGSDSGADSWMIKRIVKQSR